MSILKKITIGFKIIYYLLRLVIAPKSSIVPLIKLGNLLTDSKSFEQAAEKVLVNDGAKRLCEQLYAPGIPCKETLLGFPENTFAYALGSFMDKNNLTLYPYPIKKTYSPNIYLRERRRQIHDILHVVLGYDTSLEGESQVNAFISGQASFPIPVVISSGVLLISLFKFPMRTSHIYAQNQAAFLRGKACPSIFSIQWENYFNQPFENIQKLFDQQIPFQ